MNNKFQNTLDQSRAYPVANAQILLPKMSDKEIFALYHYTRTVYRIEWLKEFITNEFVKRAK